MSNVGEERAETGGKRRRIPWPLHPDVQTSYEVPTQSFRQLAMTEVAESYPIVA